METETRRNRRNFVLISATSFFLYFVSSYLSTAVHEIAHLVTAWVFGGRPSGMYLAVFGWSYASSMAVKGNFASFLHSFSGVLIQFLFGLLVFFVIYPRLRGFLARLFALQISFVSVISSLTYLGSDALIQHGDGAAIVSLSHIPGGVYAFVCFVVFIAMLRPMSRPLFSFVSEYVSQNTKISRFLSAFAIVGMPLIFSAGMMIFFPPFVPPSVLITGIITVPIVCLVVSKKNTQNNQTSFLMKPVSLFSFPVATALFAVCMAVWIIFFGIKGSNNIALINLQIRMRPGDAALYVQRSWVEVQNKQYNIALRDADRALELKPNLWTALNTKAFIYLEMKRYPEASRYLHAALSAHPCSCAVACIQYNLACTYALMNDHENAFKWLDSAVKAGWRNEKHTIADTDLRSLRGDPRFKSLLLEMEISDKTKR